MFAVAAVAAGVFSANLLSDARELRDQVASLTGERDALQGDVDALQGDVDTISGELDTVQSELTDANAAVGLCQQAVETAQGFTGLFEELAALDALWWETEEGSAEEADLEAAAAEIGAALLRAEGRFATQAGPCLTAGAR
jgi:chromosome segregation ATPase